MKVWTAAVWSMFVSSWRFLPLEMLRHSAGPSESMGATPNRLRAHSH